MYLTAGTFNIILRQVSLLEMDEAEVFSVLGIDSSLFEKTTNKVDGSIVGRFLEYIASQRPNIRIGLKRCISKITSLCSCRQYGMFI